MRTAPASPSAPATTSANSAAPSARPAAMSPTASAARPGTSAAPALPEPFRFSGGKNAVVGTRGLLVAVEEQAVRIGVAVLEKGGNAVDAAIATALALAVTHPSAASLGGGGFALIRPLGGPTTAVDFRETAPGALTRPGFEKMIAAGANGKAAVGVPGVIAGMSLIHARFATRPFAELVEPALALARDGYALGPFQAKLLRSSFGVLGRDRAARAIFSERGRPHAAGSRLVQSDLAWSLDRLARSPDDFYRGQLAERLALALAPDGPSLEDLANYKAVLREPLRFRFRDYGVETMPPPSAGGVALTGMLLALGSLPPQNPSSIDGVHALLEAGRRAQLERRLRVRDPDSFSVEERERRQNEWLDARFWLKTPINPDKATPSEELSRLSQDAREESEHTTHLSVADASGMVVSWTTTLSASFGARIVAQGTGIVLNNSVASFSRTGDNLPVARRRTTSSMAPSLLLRGDNVAFVLGTPGGDTIPSTLAQIVRHLVDGHASLAEAIEAPRFHHGFVPDLARYEPSIAALPELLRGLRARGHRLKAFGRRVGDANCILMESARAVGYADSREPGVAMTVESR